METGNHITHIDEQPWRNFSAADYSVEQWHNSCLIHMHDGPPTSKNECKLPVKTPSGTVNRNGVHAAAAALAGARGGVHASTDQKTSAAKALIRLYGQLDEDPPPSLLEHSGMDFDDILAHYGVKGMKWGVRRDRDDDDVISTMSDEQLRALVNRIKLENDYRSAKKSANSSAGKQFVAKHLNQAAAIAFGAIVTTAVQQALKKVINKD